MEEKDAKPSIRSLSSARRLTRPSIAQAWTALPRWFVLLICAGLALRIAWWEVVAVAEAFGPWWPGLLQLAVFLGFSALTGRWLVGFVSWTAWVSFVRLLSRIKFEYLHTPMDASDLRYLDVQSLAHTLSNYPWIIAAVGAAILASLGGLYLVWTWARPIGWPVRAASLAMACAIGLTGQRALAQMPRDGELMDSRSMMSLALSFFLEPADLPVAAVSRLSELQVSCPENPPDIMVVLEESTFRSKRAAQSEDASLKGFFGGDVYAGPMHVHVYGGKTHLTDFAFLIGVPHAALSGEREYLSRTLVGRIGLSLPKILRHCGYESSVLYPVSKSYFNSFNWFSAAGFDHVIAPEDAGVAGPAAWHAPDARFFEKALKIAQAARKPQLIYVLTIAQHGPHDEGSDPSDEYHRRLQSSAQDFYQLRQSLESLPGQRPWLLGWFGDHRPYRVDEDDGANKYTTWATLRTVGRGAKAPPAQIAALPGLDIAFFSHVVLRAIDVKTGPLGAVVDTMLQECAADYFKCTEERRDQHHKALRAVGAILPVSQSAGARADVRPAEPAQ